MRNNPDKKVQGRKTEVAMLNRQRERFEESFKVAFHLVFINMGLGKQKTAKNFVVSLNEFMDIGEIARRMEIGFGNL